MFEELNRCTVRLKVGSELGTGFFVAPGLILTCAHVVKEAIDQTNQPINVWWQNQCYGAVIDKLPENIDLVDLALLKFQENLPNHPCVVLDESITVGDELYAFGYTDQNIQGDSATFEYEGFDGNKLLKFKEGQVRPGFSGSPLLNQKTGKVCGVVKKTRDRSFDLGGRAVSVTVVFTTFPELRQHQSSLPQVIPPNPFIPRSGIVKNSKEFFGREKEINRVFETLNSGSSVALIGTREIGKSSLLWTIKQQAETKLIPPRKAIYLDMSQVYDEDDFYYALCSEVGIEDCKGIRLTRALKKQHPQLLLLLDEIEKMTWDGFTNQVRGQLRGLANGHDAPLRLVVAASTSLDQLFPDSNEIGMVSPFQNICIEEQIELWDEATVRDFIRDRLKNNPIQFTETEISEIITRCGGYPREIMEMCYGIYALYVEGMKQ
ncbi:MAG: trypsin-like peptidase domain-containing protein [Cyanobacteria bacterium P01_D01_bin.50]